MPIRGSYLPYDRPPGCTFGPRCDHFVSGRCNRPPIPMEPVQDDPGHAVRCVRYLEIDWSVKLVSGIHQLPIAFGPLVLEVRNMKKYYEVRDTSFSGVFFKRRRDLSKPMKSSTSTRVRRRPSPLWESRVAENLPSPRFSWVLKKSTGGEVLLHGKEIGDLPVRRRSPQLIGSLQIVFQNPFETLNPSHSIGWQIKRVLKKYGVGRSREEIQERVFELLDMVKLPRAFAYRKPRQLSGGQKQRIGIARAFGGEAAVVIADEPVSALDVSVQAAVTGLLTDIQRQKRTTMIFISHDLSVVRYLADRVIVMYLGWIMEQGTTDQIFFATLPPLYGSLAVCRSDRRYIGSQETHRA